MAQGMLLSTLIPAFALAAFCAGVIVPAAAQPSPAEVALAHYLKASNTGSTDQFGNSVAVAANSATESTVVVGAPFEDSCASSVNGIQVDTPPCTSSGAAYVFSCSSTTSTCTQVAYLKARNSFTSDTFGRSVSVTANSATESMVVVGADGEDSCGKGVGGDVAQSDNGCPNSGSAYVFTCSPTGFPFCTQMSYLKASNTDGDGFGYSVAVSANSASESIIVVGAYGEGSCATGIDGNATNNECSRAGAGYVFTCSSTTRTCTQVAYLKASNTGSADFFGWSVAAAASSTNKSTVVVGAEREASCTKGVNGGNGTDDGCFEAGAAYVFTCSSLTGGTCTQLAYIKASNTGAVDRFGGSVAVSANSAVESTVVVGARQEASCSQFVNDSIADNNCFRSGAGYVFTCSSATTCTQLAYVKASNTRVDDFFGSSVAVAAKSATESMVVVGARAEDSCATGVGGNQTVSACPPLCSPPTFCQAAGAAYAFTCSSLTGGTCIQLAYLKSSNTGQFDLFGKSVAVTANSATASTIVIGAYEEASCATDGTDNDCPVSGSAYMFTAVLPLTTTGTTATTGDPTTATTGDPTGDPTIYTSGDPTISTTGVTTATSATSAGMTTGAIAPATAGMSSATSSTTGSGSKADGSSSSNELPVAVTVGGAVAGLILILVIVVQAAVICFLVKKKSLGEDGDLSLDDMDSQETSASGGSSPSSAPTERMSCFSRRSRFNLSSSAWEGVALESPFCSRNRSKQSLSSRYQGPVVLRFA